MPQVDFNPMIQMSPGCRLVKLSTEASTGYRGFIKDKLFLVEPVKVDKPFPPTILKASADVSHPSLIHVYPVPELSSDLHQGCPSIHLIERF